MNQGGNKNIVILTGLVIMLAIIGSIALFFYIFSKPKEPIKQTQILLPTPIPLPTGLDANYNNFNYITPGKSTREEVIQMNGQPSSVSTFGDKTYLYFKTPFKGIDNKVLLTNNKVVYAMENVFGNYRGSFSSYSSVLGKADLMVYEKDPTSYPWQVFLSKGLAIQQSNDLITGIIYFAPTDKAGFIKNIASDTGLSENLPSESDIIGL